MRFRHHLLAASLGIGVFCAAPARESAACGNEVEFRVDPRIQLVAQADKNTAEGKHREALASLKLVLPKKGDLPAGERVVERAYVVAALAVARSDGAYDIRGLAMEGEEGASLAMNQAIAIAKHAYAKAKDDNTVKTNYAEILSHVPEHAAEAKRILAELEGADLVTSAQGYAALARLRQDAGLGSPAWLSHARAARERALMKLEKVRCERMASEKGVCSA
jgi:hypothetical protein